MSNVQGIRFKKKSRFSEIAFRFLKNKTAIIGMILFSTILLCMIFADVIVPYEKALEQHEDMRFLTPCSEYPFGADSYGRDIFARIIHGARRSLLMGIIAVAAGISIGGIFGAVSGYYGGAVDSIISRIMDTIMCIPFMLLALAIVAALGSGYINVLIALVISNVPTYTRTVRSAILSVVDQDYIEAARTCGASDFAIIFRHILPNAIGTIIVQATMAVGSMIIVASSLSFLGMGIQPPTPEWGAMLSEGKDYMLNAPHLVIFPGLAIAATALSLNLMGDGLRDALDPRLKD